MLQGTLDENIYLNLQYLKTFCPLISYSFFQILSLSESSHQQRILYQQPNKKPLNRCFDIPAYFVILRNINACKYSDECTRSEIFECH